MRDPKCGGIDGADKITRSWRHAQASFPPPPNDGNEASVPSRAASCYQGQTGLYVRPSSVKT